MSLVRRARAKAPAGLLRLLSDENADTRLKAAWALGQIEDAGARYERIGFAAAPMASCTLPRYFLSLAHPIHGPWADSRIDQLPALRAQHSIILCP